MTSLAALLGDITTKAWTGLTEGTMSCADAAGALREAARLFELVALNEFGDGAAVQERRRALYLVSKLCRTVGPPDAEDAPAEPGRLSQLMAVARDVTTTMSPALSTAERWALACELLDPVSACAGVVRELANTPALLDLARGLDTLRRWSTQCPPAASDHARLDQARPTTVVSGEATVSLLGRQMDRIAYRATTSDLDPSDARYVAAAALHVAIYARPILSKLAEPGTQDAAHDISNSCLMSWFTVRDALRDVAPAPRPTPWAPAVAEFATDLRYVFGPPDSRAVIHADAPSAAIATAYRALLNRLPELAGALVRAAVDWGIPTRPVIDTDVPICWRDHTGVERYAGIAPSRIDPLVSAGIAVAARTARRSSVIISAHADAGAMRLGKQPHPHLAKAHLAEVASAQATPESRWRRVVDQIDQRVPADSGWPVLARILDLAAGDGWDVTGRLPHIAANLPDRQTAAELTYRVLAECQLERSDPGEPVPADPHHERRVPPSPPSPHRSLPAQVPRR